ncbi:PAS domain-containing protein [Chamaesiphon sp.]|uniref:PAS domain-containing sensor histidine kinase n=1 Tax=Chamaesiphon sp. TaxID=2814140 RepID=UPI003593BE9C
MSLLQQLSTQVSVAIRQAELYQQAQAELAERKRTEEMLRSSEERLRVGLEAARMGTWDWNILESQIIWSSNMESLFGLAPGEFDGSYEQFVARLHPDDRDRVLAAIAAAMTPGTNYDIEFRVLYPDGTIRWALSQGKVFHDASGQPMRMSGVDLDITGRKQAEDELLQAQALAQNQLMEIEAIYQTAPIGLTIIDVDLRFGRINQRLAEINGVAIAEHIGRTVREVVPDLADEAEPLLRQVLETGEPLLNLEISGETIAQPGIYRTWNENFYPLKDRTGRTIGINIVTQEITEAKREEVVRKRAAEALQESETRFRQLAENIDAVFWLREEPEGRVSYVSSAYERLWGWQPQELYESPSFWIDHIHPDDRECTSQAFQSKAAAGEFDEEYRIVLSDGRIRWVNDRCFPLYDRSGKLYRFAGIAEDISDRKQAEDSLRRSEEFNRRILENNQDCIKVLDLEGRLLYMNDGGKQLLEIADFADYDRSLWTQFWGGSEQELAQAAFAAATAGTIGKFEGQCPTATGVPKWWEVSVIPLHDADGHVEQILVISHDLTERRQAEDELRQSQALVQSQLMEIEAIYQTAPIGLAILDVDLRFERVNHRLAEMNGVSIADHIGRTVREVIGDLADRNEPLLRQVLETGEPLLNLEISGETIAQPGIYRTWISNFHPLKDSTGQSIGINVVVQEITDRKRAEVEIRQSESKVRRVLDNLFSFVGMMTPDGTLIEANNTALGAASLSPEDVLGKPFPDAYWWAYDTEIQAQLWAAIRQAATGETVRYDVQVRLGEDQFIIIDFCLAPLLYDSGEVEFLIPSGIDITERKQLQLALQAQTVELTKTTALLELRNQELNRFSYTVSHDLKAPLRGISNLAAWIRDDLPPTIDPDILTNLDLMRSRVDRMDSLITGLLEYAQVGSTAASLATFKVEQLLAEIVDSLSIPDSFVVELPADLPPITTNRVLLSQVLANLIGNAYKHHDRADGRIQVTVQPDAQMWEFSVTDDGRGIALANQADVFDIFRTLSGANKNNTGIGLSIVKKLVETQGGEITLESQLGIGTTFKFTWLCEI